MAQAITVSDGQGRIERENPEFSRLIGMPWPDYRGARWLKALHSDDVKLIAPADTVDGEHHAGARKSACAIRRRAAGAGIWCARCR